MVNFKIMIYQKEKQEINVQEIVGRIIEYYKKISNKKEFNYIKFEIKDTKM